MATRKNSGMARLHDLSPAISGTLPVIPLGHGPTPVAPLGELAAGRAEIWLKDEGRFGDGGWGGNKVRKLEWLLAEAKRRRRGILTFGGLGTNWGLATALYGREHGVPVAMALIDQPRDAHVVAQLNRLRASGATLHLTGSRVRTVAALPVLVARHSRRGRPPLVLPPGGSSPLGVLGAVETGLEIAAQVENGSLPEPALVVVPLGSGGTAAGLLLAFRLAGLNTRVFGVVVSDQPRLDPEGIASKARAACRLLHRRGFDRPLPVPDRDGVTVVRDWLGTGYGHPTPDADRAVADSAAADGPELDPVYTGKAMAAVRAMNAEGSLGDGPVLFLNTNGPR